MLPGDGAGGFLAPTDYPTGTYPQSVAVGDFNADGKPDLATANGDDNTVSVLLNATCTTAYAVTGGGAYCAGGSGRAVGLDGSKPGVNYQLKRDNSNVGAPVAGTGAAISFGNQTLAGSYTVTATNATTSCTAEMTGSASVSVNPLPMASIGGNNGPICAGGNATFSVSGTSGATLTYTLTGLSGNQTLLLNGGSQTITASGATSNVILALVSVANSSCSQNLTGTSTVTVNPLPTVNAGPDQSVILGFGSNCTDLTATPSGGSGGNYSFTWNPVNLTGPMVNVCPQITTTYTVTLTDGNGCRATYQVTVNVQDVRCGPGNKNVQICYYGVTQCVSEKIAKNYIKLGATLGACGSSATRLGVPEPEKMALELSLKAFPNPVVDQVTVEVFSPAAGTATMEVLDVTGRARQSRQQQLVQGLNEVEFRLGTLPPGIYLIQVRRGYGVDPLGQQGTVRVSKQ